MNATTAPLPSLFGRFTAMLQGHDHLAKTIRRLRATCAALEGDELVTALDVSPRLVLNRLRAELGEHFAAEEGEAYFGVVIDEAPHLASQVAQLKREHEAMLEAADLLVELALDQRCWDSLVTPIRRLVAEIERHEHAETVLLAGLFSPEP